jgi:hypothetical protein
MQQEKINRHHYSSLYNHGAEQRQHIDCIHAAVQPGSRTAAALI